jgi:hypothetical protein
MLRTEKSNDISTLVNCCLSHLSPQVQAISQPIHSSDWALNRAREAAEALKADFAVIDQTKLHTELQVSGQSQEETAAC